MPKLTCQITMSLDGFVAGPSQSLENPLGEGGMRVHDWAFAADGVTGLPGAPSDAEILQTSLRDIGAVIMGRHMFGGGAGDWDECWRGWWGEDPPYHAPTYVLTHHARDPLSMEGGTTFHFVTDGIESALDQARAVAGDRDVTVAGGADVVQQYLAAGHLDELDVHVAPVFLGSGERLFANLGDAAGIRLELVQTFGSARVSHLRYRVVR